MDIINPVGAIHGPIVAGEAAKCKKDLEELIKNLHKSTFDVAELLHKVRKNGYYRPDFDTFKEYLKSLDIKMRKAQYLDRIVDVMEQVGIDRNTYEPIGISKLREVCSLEPNETYIQPGTGKDFPMSDLIHGLVDKAPSMTLQEVQENVRTLKGFVGDNDIVNKTFGWTRETYEKVIEPALELAKKNIGSVGRDAEGNAIDPSDSKCAEVWAVEYSNDPANNTF